MMVTEIEIDLSPTADAPLGFTRCNRCRTTPGFGPGVVVHLGISGLCYECDGKAKIRIPTEADKAHAAYLADLQTRYMRLSETIRTAINALPTMNERGDARNGLNHLRTRDYLVRFTKMLDAVEAGRVDAVVRHLITFWREVRETL